MVQGFLLLLLCLLIGDVAVFLLDIPIPGSVVGMVLLLGGLMLYGRVPDGLRSTSEGLLKILPLLLVPAGVGLMNHFGVLSQYWWQLTLILLLSTLLTMLVVAGVLKLMSDEKLSGDKPVCSPRGDKE